MMVWEEKEGLGGVLRAEWLSGVKHTWDSGAEFLLCTRKGCRNIHSDMCGFLPSLLQRGNGTSKAVTQITTHTSFGRASSQPSSETKSLSGFSRTELFLFTQDSFHFTFLQPS